MTEAVMLPKSKWRWHDLPEVSERVVSQYRIRENFRIYAEMELALGHGHTVSAWDMARLADANVVDLGGSWAVWGPCPRRPPADADLDAAEDALRALWRDRIAVPAYNYPSYHGHLTYVPWSEWRAERRPRLDDECFRSDHARLYEALWSKRDDDDGEGDE